MTRSGTIRIRAVTEDADLATIADIVAATTPDDPTTPDEMRWADRTYPGTKRFLADLEGATVGAATVGRIFSYGPDYRDLWASVNVRESARRRGVGSVLLDVLFDHARRVGKAGLQVRATVDRPHSIAFLERRGFVEIERSPMLRLDLAGRQPPGEPDPDGIVLTTLADRPDLVEGVHLVALEAFADIPTADEPLAVGELAEFRARDVDRPGIPPDGFIIGVDAASGEVVGYASLMMIPGSTTAAWHDMTAVRPAWRRRGIALALKRGTIAWAIRHGLHSLDTGNDEDNGAMRAVNARLGYQPLPDEVTMRGPVPAPDQRDPSRAGIMGR